MSFPTDDKRPSDADVCEQWYEDLVVQTQFKLLKSLSAMLPKEEAEEVIQETYLKLFINFKQQKPDNPTAYVYRVARNLAISRLRNKEVASSYVNSAELIQEETPELTSPYNHLDLQVEKERLLAAINGLSPICRQVFVLRKIHDKSHQEIANTLGISTKTVENHITKGMRECMRQLQKKDADQVRVSSNKPRGVA